MLGVGDIVDFEKSKTCKNASKHSKILSLVTHYIPALEGFSHITKIHAYCCKILSDAYAGRDLAESTAELGLSVGLAVAVPPYSIARAVAFGANTLGEALDYQILCFAHAFFEEAEASFLQHFTATEAMHDHPLGKPMITASSVATVAPIQVEVPFRAHIKQIRQTYHLNPTQEEAYATLCAAGLKKHLYFDQQKEEIQYLPLQAQITPQQTPLRQPTDFGAEVMARYQSALEQINDRLPELYEAHFGHQIPLSDPSVFIEELCASVAGQSKATPPDQQLLRPERAPVVSESFSLTTTLGNVALIAGCCGKPHIEQGLHRAITSMHSFKTGMHQLSQNGSTLMTTASGIVSLTLGLTAAVSSIFSFFSNTGNQLKAIDEKLHVIINNQIQMAKTLDATLAHVTTIENTLNRFARNTDLRLDFLIAQPLREALQDIDLTLKGTHAMTLSSGEIKKCLLVLLRWLTLHFQTPALNARLYEHCPDQEVLGILTHIRHTPAAFNFLGFVLKRLQVYGLQIPEILLTLPPLEPFLEVTRLFCHGMLFAKPNSQDQCRTITAQLEAMLQRFAQAEVFLTTHCHEIQEKLLLVYIAQTYNAFVLKRSEDFIRHQMDETRLLLQIVSLWSSSEALPFFCHLESWEDLAVQYLSKQWRRIHDTHAKIVEQTLAWLYTRPEYILKKNLHTHLHLEVVSDKGVIHPNYTYHLYRIVPPNAPLWQSASQYYQQAITSCNGSPHSLLQQFFTPEQQDDWLQALLFIVAKQGEYAIFDAVNKQFSSFHRFGAMQFRMCLTTSSNRPFPIAVKPSTVSQAERRAAYTPLMFAARFNRMDVVEGLLQKHAQGIDIGLHETGASAAKNASDYGHHEIAIRINRLLNDSSKKATYPIESASKLSSLGNTREAIQATIQYGIFAVQHLRKSYETHANTTEKPTSATVRDGSEHRINASTF